MTLKISHAMYRLHNGLPRVRSVSQLYAARHILCLRIKPQPSYRDDVERTVGREVATSF